MSTLGLKILSKRALKFKHAMMIGIRMATGEKANNVHHMVAITSV